MGFQRVFQAALVASSLLSPVLGGRFSETRKEQEKRHAHELTKRHSHKHEKRQDPTSDFQFLNNNTQRKSKQLFDIAKKICAGSLTLTWNSAYLVSSLPDVPFDIGEMYGGLVPIDMDDPSRQLFFMFQPTVGSPVDEVTIWYVEPNRPDHKVQCADAGKG